MATVNRAAVSKVPSVSITRVAAEWQPFITFPNSPSPRTVSSIRESRGYSHLASIVVASNLKSLSSCINGRSPLRISQSSPLDDDSPPFLLFAGDCLCKERLACLCLVKSTVASRNIKTVGAMIATITQDLSHSRPAMLRISCIGLFSSITAAPGSIFCSFLRLRLGRGSSSSIGAQKHFPLSSQVHVPEADNIPRLLSLIERGPIILLPAMQSWGHAKYCRDKIEDQANSLVEINQPAVLHDIGTEPYDKRTRLWGKFPKLIDRDNIYSGLAKSSQLSTLPDKR
uniref:Uncharacterized protein n=1 Tax=Glossina palpalis gambiensis TaxID=67801 RepID=A0A1B0AS81_9MUSC